ncbi:DUF4179 domain-containing protein [Cytobacillus sp. IB215665]|uniref:DUF4179 domain-containing protein n=1 Tax=Cytobacillus sp. IB215665 TaxID=3097357 RepID=UPI002A0E1CBB|nr:DUF4179 domain-containing protein [Cytobacillus sp. IB215665]MDX8365346.1 DUF4179 domain-containing protein [Cytobacillus sp. IB215665]
MKDIYELLNDLDMEENEFEEMEVDDFEKNKVKKALKQSVINKNKARGWKRNVALASIIACLALTTLGLTFPTQAVGIPVIGDIFKFVGKSDIYDQHQEYARELNITEESNGIKVTIKDAVFDGYAVFFTYSIESEEDLGEEPLLVDSLDISSPSGGSGISTYEYDTSKDTYERRGSGGTKRIYDNTYVGMQSIALGDENSNDTATVEWEIKGINIPSKQQEIRGEWKFNFFVSALNGEVYDAYDSVRQDAITVHVHKLLRTPTSTVIYIQQQSTKEVDRSKWDIIFTELEIEDNLGNQYASGNKDNGTGTDSYNMSWIKTFEQLDKNATKLYITPHVSLVDWVLKEGEGYKILEKEEIVLDEIVIDLKK